MTEDVLVQCCTFHLYKYKHKVMSIRLSSVGQSTNSNEDNLDSNDDDDDPNILMTLTIRGNKLKIA